MIREIRANHESFRTVKLERGLNLILADRSERAGAKDTTNALGKSTLIEIIDFCLGSSAKQGSGLCIEPLADWEFSLDLDIAGSPICVTRAVANPGVIYVEGSTSTWPIAPAWSANHQTTEIDVKDWRRVLGWSMFSLPLRKTSESYEPSPRSLLSYFLRSHPAAYVDAFKHFSAQKTWDIQLHNAFFLGLDWHKAASWQVLKDQRNAIDALQKAIKTGAIRGELGSLGELEAERVRLEDQVSKQRESLSTFRVHPQFREIQDAADVVTEKIHSLINANFVDQRRVTRYEDVLSSEGAAETPRLETLYQEAGLLFPSEVRRTLSEAKAFHKQIVSNRKEFVSLEIKRLLRAIQERDGEIGRLTNDRAELLVVLSGKGALDELVRLQEHHSVTKQQLEHVTQRIARLREISSRKVELKIAKVELRKQAEIDLEERRQIWSRAIRTFGETSEALYKLPGRLVIDITDDGYKFGVEIPGGPSEGIGKMKVLCYDLMLATELRRRSLGIDFLIHDSTIFDGVDPRQRAHAIERAAQLSSTHSFQYICTMNTDMVPHSDFGEHFDYSKFVRLRLTDTDPSGSLLGFRY